jgi:hypothetical protein
MIIAAARIVGCMRMRPTNGLQIPVDSAQFSPAE